MDRGTALLQDLRRKLAGWQDYIKRCTHATEVLFVNKEGGEFDLVVHWVNKQQSAGEFTKNFTRRFVFGGTFSLSPNAWAIERRACDHARDIVREILSKRGVT